MADIQLTADGSQAIQTLQKIQDTVTKLQSGFKKFADDASKNLDSVKKNTDSLSKATEGLKSAIVALGVAKVAGDFMSYAKEVKGASDATGIAVNTVNDFAKAVGKAGGDTNRAVGDVIDFVAQLNEAKQGSAGAQAELSKMGISLNDLATLSNEDIFKKTLDGLNKMEDASARNALAVKYLGRNFKDINVQEVVGGMGGGKDNTQAINDAAQAMKNMNTVFAGLKQGILDAFAPLFSILAKITPEAIQTFSKIAAEVGVAAVAITGLTKVLTFAGEAALAIGVYFGAFTKGWSAAVSGLMALGGAFMKMTQVTLGGIAGLIALVAQFFGIVNMKVDETFEKIKPLYAAVVAVVVGFGLWKAEALPIILSIGKALWAMIPFIGTLIAAIQLVNLAIKLAFGVDLLDEFFGWLGKIWVKIKDILGLKDKMPDETEAETKRLKEQNAQYDEQNKKLAKVIDGQRAVTLEAQKTLDAYKQQGINAARSLGIAVSLIGVDSDRAAQIQKMADLETNYMTEVNNLKQKYIDMQRAAAVGDETEKKAFEAFAAVYNKTLKDIDKEYALQQDRLQQLLNTETILKAREQDRLNAIEAITKQMERQATLGDQLRSANDKMVDVKFNAKMTGTGNPLEGLSNVPAAIQSAGRDIQVQYAQIQEEARKAALEAGRAFAAGFEDNGDGLTPERAEELADGLDKIAKRYKDIADVQTQSLAASQTFEDGWTKAFNSYADSATNAANIANSMFSSVMNNMNSAIDNFVNTGKFSFKDMANSMIKDLIRVEMKAQAMEAMKLARGGISSAIASFSGLLGFADGGQPPLNKPSIVGENGPELFMPRSAGTVIPNGALGGSSQPTQQITNNTYITNQVSALDAKGVAQLLQENKRMLFGIVESARREMPMGAR